MWPFTGIGFALFHFYENPDIGILEAITLSRQQTQGRKWQLFCLDVSFLGWTLLASVPTLIQNFLYYSAAFRMFFDYLASPSGILMTPGRLGAAPSKLGLDSHHRRLGCGGNDVLPAPLLLRSADAV